MSNYFCGRHASVYLIPNCDDYLYIVLLSTPKTWIPVRVTMIDHPPSPPLAILDLLAHPGLPVSTSACFVGSHLPNSNSCQHGEGPVWLSSQDTSCQQKPAGASVVEQVVCWSIMLLLLLHRQQSSEASLAVAAGSGGGDRWQRCSADLEGEHKAINW